MKLSKIGEVWNSANRLLSDFIGLMSSKNFATMATWRNDFSSLFELRPHLVGGKCCHPSHPSLLKAVRTESWKLKKDLTFENQFSRPGKSLENGKNFVFFFFKENCNKCSIELLNLVSSQNVELRMKRFRTLLSPVCTVIMHFTFVVHREKSLVLRLSRFLCAYLITLSQEKEIVV